MSYLLDKKIKRKKFFKIVLGVVFLVILFYFRSGILGGLSNVSQIIFRPVLVIGHNLGEKFKNLGIYFASKNFLFQQNQSLQFKLSEAEMKMINYNAVVADNVNFREILNRKNDKINMVLSAILSKPNQSVYDTLVIDAGTMEGIKIGDLVFSLGNLPIGRVDSVYENSSKVILFSNPGDKTQAIISGKNIFMELVGRGGGNFEMILPRDLTLQNGDQVVMPGLFPYILAEVATIISDPRDPFIKALLTSPVNVQELKFVEIEI
ncbi:rod shape-determining protein MreC [Patescibacteria group bacterium]|nr:rod shape-determining protein MreC [Patescibacteria group bacterium]